MENQRQVLVDVIDHRGWRIVEEFVDNGVSATKGRDKRPGYDRLLKAATTRKLDIVGGVVGRPAWALVAALGRVSY